MIALRSGRVNNLAKRFRIIAGYGVQQNDSAWMQLGHDIFIRILPALLLLRLPVAIRNGPEYIRIVKVMADS
ncbi:hypothetical protein D3C85_1891990 [compost metagenome]